jgi:hypothetical protein
MTDPFTDARESIPSCSLSAAGLEGQRARHARLASDVVGVRRGEAELEIAFADGYDRDALAELVAVERECCPFFDLRIDDAARRLRVAVDDPTHRPALDALADALGVGSRIS